MATYRQKKYIYLLVWFSDAIIFRFPFSVQEAWLCVSTNLCFLKNRNRSSITFQFVCFFQSRAESDPLGDHLGQHLTRVWIYQTNFIVLNELHLVWLWRSDYMYSLESTNSMKHLSNVYSISSGVFGGGGSHLGCQIISTDILASDKIQSNWKQFHLCRQENIIQ